MPAIKIAFRANKGLFDLLDDEFDYDKASARILGRDIGRLLTDASRPIVERAFSDEADQHGIDSRAAVMTMNNASYNCDCDVAMAVLEELRAGISDSDG